MCFTLFSIGPLIKLIIRINLLYSCLFIIRKKKYCSAKVTNGFKILAESVNTVFFFYILAQRKQTTQHALFIGKLEKEIGLTDQFRNSIFRNLKFCYSWSFSPFFDCLITFEKRDVFYQL
jgi:hypothetical protein